MIAAIIQARIGSRRLPAKVVADIMGKPLLARVIERVKQAACIDKVILASTTRPEDKELGRIAGDCGAEFFAGNEDDVLDRFYQAAKTFGADIVVRITADCPLIDPRIIDKVVRRYLEGDCDYATNTLVVTYPDGLDVEVFSFKVLERAWKEARLASEREHVTPYMRNPAKFRLANVANSVDISSLRWTVDEEKDLVLVREIYKHLYKAGQMFYMEDVLDLVRKFPRLSKINQDILRNEGYAKSLREDRIGK